VTRSGYLIGWRQVPSCCFQTHNNFSDLLCHTSHFFILFYSMPLSFALPCCHCLFVGLCFLSRSSSSSTYPTAYKRKTSGKKRKKNVIFPSLPSLPPSLPPSFRPSSPSTVTFLHPSKRNRFLVQSVCVWFWSSLCFFSSVLHHRNVSKLCTLVIRYVARHCPTSILQTLPPSLPLPALLLTHLLLLQLLLLQALLPLTFSKGGEREGGREGEQA